MNVIEEITRKFNEANNSRDGRNISINDVQQFEIDILKVTDGYRKEPEELSRKKVLEQGEFDFGGLVDFIKNEVGSNQRSNNQEKQDTPDIYFAVDREKTYATQYLEGNEVTINDGDDSLNYDRLNSNNRIEMNQNNDNLNQNQNLNLNLNLNQNLNLDLNSNSNSNSNISVTDIKQNKEKNYTVTDIQGDYQTLRKNNTIDNSVHIIDMGEPIEKNYDDEVDR